jgi:hypothetical protein
MKVLDRSANSFKLINAKQIKLIYEKKADYIIKIKKQIYILRTLLEQSTA